MILIFLKKNNIKLFKQNPLYCVENQEFNQSIINLIIKKIKLPKEKNFLRRSCLNKSKT